MDITIDRNLMLRNVRGMDITSERNVTGMDITSERNVQGWTLQVRGMYSGWRFHVNVTTFPYGMRA
jgi:hypothetical protein